MTAAVRTLLAVDLGLRTGIALYGDDGRLRWYRSQHYGAPSRLRRAAGGLLDATPGLCCVVLEGGGDLADLWVREGTRRSLRTRVVGADLWRQRLLLPREQRRGSDAKRHADTLARRVIAWSEAPRPTSLRHDAAEAILVGLWGVLELGWLEAPPVELRR